MFGLKVTQLRRMLREAWRSRRMMQSSKHELVPAHALFKPPGDPGDRAGTQTSTIFNGRIGHTSVKHARGLPALPELHELILRQKVTKELPGFLRRFERENGPKKLVRLRIFPGIAHMNHFTLVKYSNSENTSRAAYPHDKPAVLQVVQQNASLPVYRRSLNIKDRRRLEQ